MPCLSSPIESDSQKSRSFDQLWEKQDFLFRASKMDILYSLLKSFCNDLRVLLLLCKESDLNNFLNFSESESKSIVEHRSVFILTITFHNFLVLAKKCWTLFHRFFEGRSLVQLVQSCPFIFSFHILKVGHSERCWLYDELLVKNDGPSFWGFSFVEFKRVTRRESKDWFYPEQSLFCKCLKLI